MRIFWLIGWVGVNRGQQSEGQTISIAAPSLSEEEQFSVVIPPQYRCDGCYAVATQILHAVTRHKGIFAKHVFEDDAIDVVENACDEKNFQSYGLSLINGKNKLTGPGIASDNTGPTAGSGFITMSGGMWPKRLKTRCNEVVNDTDLLALVDLALRTPENAFTTHFCKKIVRDCRNRKQASPNSTIATQEIPSMPNMPSMNPAPQRMSHDEF